MLRRGFLDPPIPEEQEEHPLFGPAAQQKLRAVEGSEVWRWLRQGLHASREALFASRPASTEDLWRTWGALETLTTLLHGGPATVLQYSELASSREKEKKDDEAEYIPLAHRARSL